MQKLGKDLGWLFHFTNPSSDIESALLATVMSFLMQDIQRTEGLMLLVIKVSLEQMVGLPSPLSTLRHFSVTLGGVFDLQRLCIPDFEDQRDFPVRSRGKLPINLPDQPGQGQAHHQPG